MGNNAHRAGGYAPANSDPNSMLLNTSTHPLLNKWRIVLIEYGGGVGGDQ